VKYIINETQFEQNMKFIEENIESQEFSPQQQRLIKIVNSIQDGEMSLEELDTYVGGFEILVKKLDDMNILSYINPFNERWEYYQNILFKSFIELDSSFVWKIVDAYLSDVIKEGDKYYVVMDADDLSEMFRTSSDISQEGIESIILGENDWDTSYDVTDDEYNDVYDNLAKDKKKFVDDRIKKTLSEMKTLDVNSKTPSLIDEIAQEQGKESEIELTNEVIERLMQDDTCVEYLIMEEMDDIRSDLYTLYSGCYDGVLRDSWYYDIMRELVGFVIDDIKRESYSYQKRTYDKEGNPVMKTVYREKYLATNCIYDVVNEWINSNQSVGGYTVEYYYSYRNLIDDLIYRGDREKLSAPRLDDYADHRQVEKCINESIRDYF
jgi:hypothetical protein